MVFSDDGTDLYLAGEPKLKENERVYAQLYLTPESFQQHFQVDHDAGRERADDDAGHERGLVDGDGDDDHDSEVFE